MATDYYIELPLLFCNKEKVIQETQSLEWSPFQKATGHTGNYFDKVDHWLVAYIDDPEPYEEIYRIYNIIEYVTESADLRVRLYRQKKDTEIPYHKDLNTKAGVNFIINDNAGPITFEDIGDVQYERIVMNNQQMHMIKKHPAERILLKYSIFDLEWETVRDRLSIFKNVTHTNAKVVH